MKSYVLLALVLAAAMAVKVYFIHHPSEYIFALSFTDITKLSGLVEKKPVPIPYIDSFVEYPVMIGLFIWLVGMATKNRESYFLLTGLVLSCLALASFYLSEKGKLGREKIRMTLFWLAAPTVFLFTVYNWDVLAVFFMISALFLYRKNHDLTGTLFLTLGVWTKFFPIFVLPAVLLRKLMKGERTHILLILLVFLLVSLAVNLPFFIGSPKGWSVFFSFSRERGPNIDSVWAGLFVISDKFFGRMFPLKSNYTTFINYFSNLLLLFLLSAFYLRAWRKKFDGLNTLSLAGISLFLITAKVYSPPYNYWVLPLAVLAPLGFRDFFVFDVANMLVFFAIFEYFYQTNILGLSFLSFPWYKVAYFFVLLRHIFLLKISLQLWRKIGHGEGS